jgi:hypothetical protein
MLFGLAAVVRETRSHFTISVREYFIPMAWHFQILWKPINCIAIRYYQDRQGLILAIFFICSYDQKIMWAASLD